MNFIHVKLVVSGNDGIVQVIYFKLGLPVNLYNAPRIKLILSKLIEMFSIPTDG